MQIQVNRSTLELVEGDIIQQDVDVKITTGGRLPARHALTLLPPLPPGEGRGEGNPTKERD